MQDGQGALTGKGGLARMSAAYEEFRREGRLPATYEVVYGQAWCPAGRSLGARAGRNRRAGQQHRAETADRRGERLVISG